jgi:hypothetical protein
MNQSAEIPRSPFARDRDVPEPAHQPSVDRDLEMGFKLPSSKKLGNGRIQDKGVEQVDVVGNEYRGALRVKARRLANKEPDAGQSNDIAGEEPLKWIALSRINEYCNDQQDEGADDKVNPTYEPKE